MSERASHKSARFDPGLGRGPGPREQGDGVAAAKRHIRTGKVTVRLAQGDAIGPQGDGNGPFSPPHPVTSVNTPAAKSAGTRNPLPRPDPHRIGAAPMASANIGTIRADAGRFASGAFGIQ